MISRLTAVGLALLLPAAALSEEVAVTDPWARASITASRPAAAYMTIESSTGDRLIGISTPVAESVVIHAVREEDGINRMVHLPALDLPAGEPVTLAPGGMHAMLMGLDAKLVEGESFPMTLRFEKALELTIEVPVLGIAAQGPEKAGG